VYNALVKGAQDELEQRAEL